MCCERIRMEPTLITGEWFGLSDCWQDVEDLADELEYLDELLWVAESASRR